MPSMNFAKHSHSLVVVRNKLFSVSVRRDACEVFDDVSKKFVALISPEFKDFSHAINVGNKLFVFQYDKKKVACYDTDKNKWSEKNSKVTENLASFSCVKIPCKFFYQ